MILVSYGVCLVTISLFIYFIFIFLSLFLYVVTPSNEKDTIVGDMS